MIIEQIDRHTPLDWADAEKNLATTRRREAQAERTEHSLERQRHVARCGFEIVGVTMRPRTEADAVDMFGSEEESEQDRMMSSLVTVLDPEQKVTRQRGSQNVPSVNRSTMNNQGEHHMRCYECGNRITDGQEECPMCHAAQWALGATAALSTSTPPAATTQDDAVAVVTNQGRQDVFPSPSRGQMVLQQTGSAVAGAASAAQSVLALVIPTKRSVCGRVILADACYSERPDWDICKIITRILWIILLLLSPFLILYWLVVKVGGLPALLAIVGVFLLFKFVSPTNLWAMFRIFSVLNPTTRDPAVQVPVRYFRIREDGSDAEVMVRMKGQFTHGNIGLDDHVTVRGRSRRGTLYAHDGYNHRTASSIRLAHSYSWVGLVLTLLVIFALVSALHEPTAKIARTLNSIGGAQ